MKTGGKIATCAIPIAATATEAGPAALDLLLRVCACTIESP
jgi:hypothetical protein